MWNHAVWEVIKWSSLCLVQSSDSHLYFSYVKTMYTAGYTLSLITLTIAITIFCLFRWETHLLFSPFNLFFHIRDVHQITAEPTLNWLKYAITCECRYSFRKLHCTRNYIHIQMFISFILRAIFIFIRDSLLFTNEEHYHCDHYPVWMDGRFVIPLLLSFRQGHECDELTFSPCAQVACKVVLMLTNYSILANYSWLLVEGHFLFTLVSRSFFSLKKHLAWYIVLSWGKEPGWQESSAA